MSEQIKPTQTTQEIIDSNQIEFDLDIATAKLHIKIQALLNDMEKARHLRNIRDRKLNDLNAPESY